MHTLVWQKVPNHLVPAEWVKNIEIIKLRSKDNRLTSDRAYSLSFQKNQLDLFTHNYLLEPITKSIYKYVDAYYAFDFTYKETRLEHQDRTFIYSIQDFITYLADYSYKYCSTYEGIEAMFTGQTLLTISC
jgi:hypothetical protein